MHTARLHIIRSTGRVIGRGSSGIFKFSMVSVTSAVCGLRDLLAGIREVVYRGSTALFARRLDIPLLGCAEIGRYLRCGDPGQRRTAFVAACWSWFRKANAGVWLTARNRSMLPNLIIRPPSGEVASFVRQPAFSKTAHPAGRIKWRASRRSKELLHGGHEVGQVVGVHAV